jgi:hypothetical protein
MARSKQTKATATPATTSARRTQASPPTNEDPPAQGSRQPLASVTSRNTRNNHATQQNDYHSQNGESNDEPWMPDMRAAVRAVSTVKEASKKLKRVAKTIDSLLAKPLKTDLDKISLTTAQYELKGLLERRKQLKAAQATGSSADSILSYTGKGKSKATVQSLSAPGSDVPAASAPSADPGGQEASEDETPQPPPRRINRRSTRQSTRRRYGQVSQSAPNNQPLAVPGSGEGPPRKQSWTHVPNKPWPVRGIKHERGRRYLIAWRPTDGIHWGDSWERKDCANAKAVRDWKRRKNIREMREYVDGASEVDYV